MVAEGYGRRDHAPHPVKNFTKLAHWVVETEEATGSSWRKDVPAYWLRIFPSKKDIHCLEKLTKISEQIWRN